MDDVYRLEEKFIMAMRNWSIPLLRVSLGLVFLWFGALKIGGVSPVVSFIADTYSKLPQTEFIILLGVWECVVGLGLILKINLRVILFLLWLQMAGTLFAPLLNPSLFFMDGNPLLLTMEGEFVIKNLVLIFAGVAIAGYQVKPKTREMQNL